MKNILTGKNHLFTRIAIGFALGILLGIFLPEFSIQIKFIGDIYLNIIQAMIIPIIFVAVSTGIINIGSGKDLGRIGFKSVFVFIIMFIATAAIGLLISYLVRPGNHINIGSSSYDGEVTSPSVEDFFMNIIPDNLFMALSEGDILVPIILFSLLWGGKYGITASITYGILQFVLGGAFLLLFSPLRLLQSEKKQSRLKISLTVYHQSFLKF